MSGPQVLCQDVQRATASYPGYRHDTVRTEGIRATTRAAAGWRPL